jgi:hypothetical protein
MGILRDFTRRCSSNTCGPFTASVSARSCTRLALVPLHHLTLSFTSASCSDLPCASSLHALGASLVFTRALRTIPQCAYAD